MQLDSKRSRIKMLHQRLEDMELRHNLARPIPSVRIRGCSHPECGQTKPRNLPPDVLIIQLGCKYRCPGREQPVDDQHPVHANETGEQSSN